jgi:hypothetical protein
MASVSKLTLDSGVHTASRTSESKALPETAKKFIGWLNVSTNNGATVIDAKIQHSPDNVNWIDFCTFTTVTNTTSKQAKHESSFAVANQGLFPNIRSVITQTGVLATVEVSLWFDPDKR